jgi:hypothetical protein
VDEGKAAVVVVKKVEEEEKKGGYNGLNREKMEAIP